MLNLKQLETFVWIANLGSFRHAADHLCTTQPAISTRISNLEESLGAQLFNRDKGAVTLTAKGRELLPLAENILAKAAQFCYRANAATALSGLLRIGVAETIVHTWLPQLLAAINDKYPDIEVELVVDLTVNLSKELLAHNIDIAILLGPVPEPSVINHMACEYPLHWVASPSLELEEKSTTSSFANWPIITYARNTLPYHEVARHFADNNLRSVQFYSVSSLSTGVKMVENGVGVGSLPREVIEPQLQTGALQIIDAEWSPSPLKFTVSYLPSPDNILVEATVGLVKEIIEA
ncbi:Cyn operon transcriptional activator [Vibrio variabilis]|uniref:Cyn operon transcriptional activator n=1 Tax=Vibrio variabilis TaxID=990271 RepID=A0ABQ0JPR2_9VIBR|nr:Cyn operon transcriptional activator [Vibrio variabilis]